MRPRSWNTSNYLKPCPCDPPMRLWGPTWSRPCFSRWQWLAEFMKKSKSPSWRSVLLWSNTRSWEFFIFNWLASKNHLIGKHSSFGHIFYDGFVSFLQNDQDNSCVDEEFYSHRLNICSMVLHTTIVVALVTTSIMTSFAMEVRRYASTYSYNI